LDYDLLGCPYIDFMPRALEARRKVATLAEGLIRKRIMQQSTTVVHLCSFSCRWGRSLNEGAKEALSFSFNSWLKHEFAGQKLEAVLK
jgi:hypothetical protein